SITVTANEQDAFFKVVEVAIGEVFLELKGKLTHLSHGMLRLPTGKMSSRTGDVITAEELIESVKEKVKGDEAVAVGAIKYMILRQAIGNDIIFDIEKSVSTEGDSGVYLQYAYARTNSLLEKAEQKPDTKAPRENTHEVEKLLYRFPEIVERAGKEYAPNYITTYLTELASSFNNFYAHEQIIGDSPESSYRLAITKAFNIVMRNGLTILGIPAPEKM
ncbi:MAG: DALR anticodon-binding domain-containing protein, partial [Minisyncoccia bacterium]